MCSLCLATWAHGKWVKGIKSSTRRQNIWVFIDGNGERMLASRSYNEEWKEGRLEGDYQELLE